MTAGGEASENLTRKEKIETRLKRDMLHTLVEYCDCVDHLAGRMDLVIDTLGRADKKMATLTTEMNYLRTDMRQHMVEAHNTIPRSPPPKTQWREFVISQRNALLIAFIGSITTFVCTYISVRGI